MTYPLIGNYGRLRRRRPVGAAVAARASSSPTRRRRSSTTRASSRRCCATNGIPAIAGVDTRALARHLRANGCLRGVDHRARRDRPRHGRRRSPAPCPRWEDQDFVAQVSPAAVREVGDEPGEPLVAIVDFGLKANIVRSLRRRGARVRVLPHTASRGRRCSPTTSTASSSRPDPATRRGSTARSRSRARSSTTAGRCSGSASATRSSAGPRARRRRGCGSATTARTTRSRTSTPGTSRSRRRTTRSRSSATRSPAASGFRVSQLNLNDRSVEGLRHAEKPIETVQYHPEGAPGPARRAGRVRPVRRRVPAGRVTPAAGTHRAKPASVLIIGAGPVVIGQAAEFDYAGTQACRALRAEGVRTILVNSNPATIMTDPDGRRRRLPRAADGRRDRGGHRPREARRASSPGSAARRR